MMGMHVEMTLRFFHVCNKGILPRNPLFVNRLFLHQLIRTGTLTVEYSF